LRKLIFAATLVAFSAPALAQPVEERIERNLPAPAEIERMGETLGRVTDAILDVPVGPIRDAVDPGRRMSRRDRDETLGDLATRDDPYARERLRDRIEDTSFGLGVMVQELAVLAPVLARSLEDATRRMEDAMERRPDRRYEDRRYEDRRYDRDERRSDRDDDRRYERDYDRDDRD
jgi:hypothetical protein